MRLATVAVALVAIANVSSAPIPLSDGSAPHHSLQAVSAHVQRAYAASVSSFSPLSLPLITERAHGWSLRGLLGAKEG